jgi:subtilisin
MKKNHEKILVSFTREQDFVGFYNNLPKKAQKKCRTYTKWHSMAFLKEDYELLKERITTQMDHQEVPIVHVENNIQYKIHESVPGSQVTPWGVSAIKAPEIWSVTEGQNVRVGIIDTGIHGTHPDLRANIKGGVNTFDKTSHLVDSNGHGTHVAGIVAALNNTFGVVGAAPSVQLYSLKAFRADGTSSLTDIAEAIDWAINNKIQILNMSFGSKETSVTLHRAVQAALRHGILMVASAGNSADSVDYPARHPEVLAIGAINQQKQIAEFSNYGKAVNYVAPGVDILSTWPVTPFYNSLSGTSMAAPHMTAICALLLSVAPHLSPAQIKSILDRSTVKLPKTTELKQGKGAVVATKVLKEFRLRAEYLSNPSN